MEIGAAMTNVEKMVEKWRNTKAPAGMDAQWKSGESWAYGQCASDLLMALAADREGAGQEPLREALEDMLLLHGREHPANQVYCRACTKARRALDALAAQPIPERGQEHMQQAAAWSEIDRLKRLVDHMREDVR